MYYVADTHRLLAEGVLTQAQVAILHTQSREVMMKLAINILLVGGIIAATLGLIPWLAAPIPVAVTGGLMLGGGLWALGRSETLGFFGAAASLIGSGLLMGGAGAELMDKYPDIAGWAMLALGAAVAGLFGWAKRHPKAPGAFVPGAICAMGVAMHLTGLGWLIEEAGRFDWMTIWGSLYSAAVLVAVGMWLNVRAVTALAIVPFAQALAVGTKYWHAAYVFYSYESTLSILQMGALIAACLWVAPRLPQALRCHAHVLAVMAAIVANLCALVGSLWGDKVGQYLWGPRVADFYTWDLYHEDQAAYRAGIEAYRAARDAWLDSALIIGEGTYSVLWALALGIAIFWSAHHAKRGMFNTAMTFAGIHAYTQLFESYGDEPLAYVIGGLAAIPAAWGLWRLDRWVVAKQAA